MTRFRALVMAGALALSFNFVGCFDHDPCEVASASGAVVDGGTDGIIIC